MLWIPCFSNSVTCFLYRYMYLYILMMKITMALDIFLFKWKGLAFMCKEIYLECMRGARVNVWSVLCYTVNSLGSYRGAVPVLFKVSTWITDIKASSCSGGDFFSLNWVLMCMIIYTINFYAQGKKAPFNMYWIYPCVFFSVPKTIV